MAFGVGSSSTWSVPLKSMRIALIFPVFAAILLIKQHIFFGFLTKIRTSKKWKQHETYAHTQMYIEVVLLPQFRTHTGRNTTNSVHTNRNRNRKRFCKPRIPEHTYAHTPHALANLRLCLRFTYKRDGRYDCMTCTRTNIAVCWIARNRTIKTHRHQVKCQCLDNSDTKVEIITASVERKVL